MKKLFGSTNNQAPLNADLGSAAYQSLDGMVVSANAFQKTKTTSSRPTVNLDFAGSQAFDSRITFFRSTSATFVGRNGYVQLAAINAPRIDFDPNTGQCRGYRTEPQSTNLLRNSAITSSTYWSAYGSTGTFTTDVVCPDGTKSCGKLPAGSSSLRQVSASITSGYTYCYSVYVKPQGAGHDNLDLFVDNNGAFPSGLNIRVDFANFTLTSTQTGFVKGRLEKAGGGWYRAQATIVAQATGGANAGVYNASGAYVAYMWGAQLEQLDHATSYIPTGSSTVTRGADVAILYDNQQTPTWNAGLFGGTRTYFNREQATIYCKYQTAGINAANGVYELGNSVGSGLDLRGGPYGPAHYFSTTTADVNMAAGFNGDYAMFSPSEGARLWGYTANSVTSTAVAVNTSILNPTWYVSAFGKIQGRSNAVYGEIPVEKLLIGNIDAGNSHWMSGWIQKIAYYPVALSEDELMEMTR